jgi:hypothetical protein
MDKLTLSSIKKLQAATSIGWISLIFSVAPGILNEYQIHAARQAQQANLVGLQPVPDTLLITDYNLDAGKPEFDISSLVKNKERITYVFDQTGRCVGVFSEGAFEYAPNSCNITPNP